MQSCLARGRTLSSSVSCLRSDVPSCAGGGVRAGRRANRNQWRKCGMSRRRAPSSCVPATPARELVVAHLPLLAIVRLLLFALRQLLSATTYITLRCVRCASPRRWPAGSVMCRLISHLSLKVEGTTALTVASALSSRLTAGPGTQRRIRTHAYSTHSL